MRNTPLGRPPLPPHKKRNNRSFTIEDKLWDEMHDAVFKDGKADSISEFIRTAIINELNKGDK